MKKSLEKLTPKEQVSTLEIAQEQLIHAMIKELKEVIPYDVSRSAMHIKIQEVMVACKAFNKIEDDINKIKYDADFKF